MSNTDLFLLFFFVPHLTSTKLVPPLPHKLKKWVDGIQGVGLRGARDRAKQRYQFSLQS